MKMENRDKILNLIFSKFPNYRNNIAELFEESESFRSMCEDYYECKGVISNLASKKNTVINWQKEYTVLLSEIEEELFNRISI